MALENIGDVSPKTRGNSYGYYIIRYVADAVEGPIALDEVKESIASSLLSTKQDEAYSAAEQSWLADAESQFKLDMNALN